MKNFSNLLVTNQQINIQITLDSITNNGIPRAGVFINNVCLLNDWLDKSVIINYPVDLLDTFKITVTMNNKVYDNDRETAVLINSIKVDNIELIPKFDHLTEYINDHNSTNPTHYLGHNGTWTLDINRPFYQWLHDHTGQGWLLTPG